MESLKLNKFLNKLFDILEVQVQNIKNPFYHQAISWDLSGEALQIKDTGYIEEIILPEYFILKKFKSFIRQLHLYGFRKLRSKSNIQIFQNLYFKRNQKNLAVYIKRKGTNQHIGLQDINCQQIQKEQTQDTIDSKRGEPISVLNHYDRSILQIQGYEEEPRSQKEIQFVPQDMEDPFYCLSFQMLRNQNY